MRKKEMIAMLLAGGQGSRLGILTNTLAKPAVAFGGKYRIIDFPLSNCINSGVDTVGILTQYRPLRLNQHIGIGIPWDLDRKTGGATILAPHLKKESGEWYQGTANAIFQNIDFIESYHPDYILILSGDHIYKMDYSKMLKFHKTNQADASIAVLEVGLEEAHRFGIMNTRSDDSIYEFEEKPSQPKSNLASMGIYIFNWPLLKKHLIEDNQIHHDSDFGQHIIPKMIEEKNVVYAYRFKDYWKDVGTVESYWQANMELIKSLPEFNLYEDFWKIYTHSDHQPPQYIGTHADIKTSIICDGCEIEGSVYNSVISPFVRIEKGAVIKDSIVMQGCTIEANTILERVIADENCHISAEVNIGMGENVPNETHPSIYNTGITVLGENTFIPSGITIGKNCVINGNTKESDYEDMQLKSGKTLELLEMEGVNV